MADDGRLDDEQEMPETLNSLGAKIAALGKQIDARFVQVDQRFEQVDKRFEQVDKRFDEVKSALGTQIDAIGDKVQHAIERLDDVLKKDVSNSAAHARMDTRLDNHELRILALEDRLGPPS